MVVPPLMVPVVLTTCSSGASLFAGEDGSSVHLFRPLHLAAPPPVTAAGTDRSVRFTRSIRGLCLAAGRSRGIRLSPVAVVGRRWNTRQGGRKELHRIILSTISRSLTNLLNALQHGMGRAGPRRWS